MNVTNQNYGFFPSFYRSISSLGYSFCYKIVSIASRCCGQKNNQCKYALLSDFYFERASSFEAYFLFSQGLLFPIVNMERIKSLVQPINLKKIDNCFNEAVLKKSVFARLERSKYPQEKITTGICAAFALKFISKYLQAIQNGQDPQKTLRALGEKFKDGGSERTGIVHGVQSTISAFSELDCFQTLANLFQVKLSEVYCCKFTNLKNVEESFTTDLDKLENGVYYVAEGNSKNPGRPGHLIVYMKHQNNRFLFDPQLGTIQIPQNKDVEYLIKSLKYASGNQFTFFKALIHR
jgi:hypothetical protein